VIKIFASELLQRLTDLLAEAAGRPTRSRSTPIATPSGKVEVAAPYLQSRARDQSTSGSSEIQARDHRENAF